MSKEDPEMQRISEVVRGGGKRSNVYQWLKARHDEFEALLQEHRPDWDALATTFAELGIKSRDGTPYTAASVRNNWYRVRRDVAAARAKKKKEQPAAVSMPVVRSPLPSAPPVPVPPAPAATPAPDDPDDPERARIAKEAFARLVAEANHRSGRK